jgi:hypothetical protein
MYKKFEALLVVTQPEPRSTSLRRSKWTETNFLSIPVTRTQFIKRTFERACDHGRKQLAAELSFFKSLPLTYRRTDRERSPTLSAPLTPISCSACNTRDEVDMTR